ncbi:MAG TPA: xanthine dehydrogenase family protein molybdopterin-binding subunit [Nitrososphaerales archaeon]|nr:xanthine dehydrogenase family protein molybdopterin-binding subunit [Nitrososphaerales archaeon]
MSSTMQTTITETQQQVVKLVGKSLKRKEDLRFLLGASRFVDDIKLPGMLHAYAVRSPYAHAKINSINLREALSSAGVNHIYTAEEIHGRITTLPVPTATNNRKPVPRLPLAEGIAKYAGEAVCFVIADSRYLAQDAGEKVDVDYDPLEGLIDPSKAMMPGSPKIHDTVNENIGNYYVKQSGSVDDAFKAADRVVKIDIVNQRVAPSPMEPRAILASYDPGTDYLTVWISNQQPFDTRLALAEVLHMPENKIRVIAPDVGGAFGAKCYLYPEDVLVCMASIDLGKPVKWIETRSENMATMFHGRGQDQHIEAAVKSDGTILGLKVKIISDSGAYASPETFGDPEVTVNMLPAQYAFRNFFAELYCVYTNKVPFDAYRGAGRPEATYLIERVIDRVSSELGLDPTEVRLKNFLREADSNFQSITGYSYEIGDYEASLKKALETVNYYRWRRIQREERSKENGRQIGIGLGAYLEISAWGPGAPQTASVNVTQTGKVKVVSGTCPHGQGHETPLAQIAADELGIDIDRITVTYGDTDGLAWGSTTGGSRSAALGGSAVMMSSRKIKQKMAQISAKELGAEAESLVFQGGKIFSKQNPSKSLSFEDVAGMGYDASKLPEGMEATLFEYSAFTPKNWTWPYGTHVAVVEVERDTGLVKVLDYVAVDDIGVVVNPMIAEGQIHGGVAQGAGQALLEGIIYDESGALVTGNFLDYQIPQAGDMFPIRWTTTYTPTKSNPLGIKGVGENGTVAATPAIVNAVEDALAQVKIKTMPLAPDYLRSLMKAA